MKYNALYLVVWVCLSWVVSPRADWPQWMGPDRNGRIRGEHLPQELDSQLQPAWRRAVGHGYAAPVVSGNDLIWVDEINDKEVAHCLALEGGKERWATPYADSYTDEFEPGPRCTPLIDEDRIYVQSCRGEFRCLNRKDGSVRWGFRFEDYGAFWVSERQANVGFGSSQT